jgi:hypothetical protein
MVLLSALIIAVLSSKHLTGLKCSSLLCMKIGVCHEIDLLMTCAYRGSPLAKVERVQSF